MAKEKDLEDVLYKVGWLVLLLGSICVFLYLKIIIPYFPAYPCVAYKLWGFYCPGCGGTRAMEALFQGRLLDSLWYHPLVIYGAVIFGGFMLTHTLERVHVPKMKGWKFHDWYLYGALILLIINFVGKNILLKCFHITM